MAGSEHTRITEEAVKQAKPGPAVRFLRDDQLKLDLFSHFLLSS
jgi:hypothetical protein